MKSNSWGRERNKERESGGCLSSGDASAEAGGKGLQLPLLAELSGMH